MFKFNNNFSLKAKRRSSFKLFAGIRSQARTNQIRERDTFSPALFDLSQIDVYKIILFSIK